MEIQEIRTPAEERLNTREFNAYRAWRGLGQPRLSPDTQAKLFALFLNGESCDEIVRLNRGFSLGQICQARVEGDWDQRRDDYLSDLLNSARTMVQQSALESIRFMKDQMSAVHKAFGDAARKFIQTGNPDDLKGFGIHDIKSYKTAVEVMQKLTGQEKKEAPASAQVVDSAPMAPRHRQLEPAEAQNIIRLQLAKGNKR